jgi:hypothetical protein
MTFISKGLGTLLEFANEVGSSEAHSDVVAAEEVADDGSDEEEDERTRLGRDEEEDKRTGLGRDEVGSDVAVGGVRR